MAGLLNNMPIEASIGGATAEHGDAGAGVALGLFLLPAIECFGQETFELLGAHLAQQLCGISQLFLGTGHIALVIGLTRIFERVGEVICTGPTAGAGDHESDQKFFHGVVLFLIERIIVV